MAETYLESLLGDNEQIILISRQHWFILIRSIFLELLTILAIIIVITLALIFAPGATPLLALGYLLLIIPLAFIAHDIMVWTNHQYIVTNRRVMQVAGVFNKSVTDSSLEKVNDVKMEQSAMGRVFEYGDIQILTASELGVNLFKRIGEPVIFKTVMLNAKEKLDFGVSDVLRPADIPTLIDKLDQLRQQGILTDAEFQEKKEALLTKL
ncbi:MAG: PH domain-containing protein [Anaerolineales bacterium]|nr:PH domain-containing protein [Anaerolineales bacterium]